MTGRGRAGMHCQHWAAILDKSWLCILLLITDTLLLASLGRGHLKLAIARPHTATLCHPRLGLGLQEAEEEPKTTSESV